MRIGIIGFGRAGRVHLDAWRAVPGVEIAAVSDPSPAIVAAARAEGLRAVAGSSELLGMPTDEREQLRAWSQAITLTLEPLITA